MTLWLTLSTVWHHPGGHYPQSNIVKYYVPQYVVYDVIMSTVLYFPQCNIDHSLILTTVQHCPQCDILNGV